MLKLKQVKDIHYSDFDYPEHESGMIYFTDVHFGLGAKFRSDNVFEKIFMKLGKIQDVYLKYKHMFKPMVVCGGDIIDRPKFIHTNSDDQIGIKPDEMLLIHSFFEKYVTGYCLGNHDVKHGFDIIDSLNMSPIVFLREFMEDFTDFTGPMIDVKFNHWSQDPEEIEWDDKQDVKILSTHEPLLYGKFPFKGTQIETYKTEADLVLMADIHDFQGVHEINNTIFVSCGALTRTHSGQKDKKPRFAFLGFDTDGDDVLLSVYFLQVLEKDDNPDEYWVDQRIERMTDNQKYETRKQLSLDLIEEKLQEEKEEVKSMDEMLTEYAKKINFNDEEVKKLLDL